MAADQKNELVPIQSEVEVIDTVDDKAIVEMMTGQTIQDYVYSFKQGGKMVEGLTLAGINEAANRRGGIQVNEINYQETEHSWIATAEAVDTITGNSRYGAFEQPKMLGTRPDPFAITKAIHKAQRNAVKQLIPVPVIREVLNFYLKRKVSNGTTEQQPQSDSHNGAISTAQKAAFAIANKLAAPLQKQGIDKTGLWDYIKRKYHVESRNDMSELQWTELSAELKAAETHQKLFEQLTKRINAVTETENETHEV